MRRTNLGQPSSTAVIYIGQRRYQLLSRHAREISFLSNSNIKASNFIHYLIDTYAEQAHEALFKQLEQGRREEGRGERRPKA